MNSQGINDIKIRVGIQYLKDLSVENSYAPAIFTVKSNEPPKIDVNYNIAVAKLSKQEDSTISSFEVTLIVTVASKVKEENSKEVRSMFVCEVKYAGIFSIEGSNEYNEKRFLFVYAPNALFPFVRQIIAANTGHCGFPPLMLDPIDFAGQFEKQQSKQKQEEQTK